MDGRAQEWKPMTRGRLLTLTFVAVAALLATVMSPRRALAVSRDEAINWAMSCEGEYLDYDGAYGAQCVDLIKYYYGIFGVANYARGNGADYASNALPPGWQRIQNTADFVPEPGDVAVWGTSLSSAGHVSIILSADLHSFVSMDQNWPKGSACTQVSHTYSKFWGVIRPAFDSPAELAFRGCIDRPSDRQSFNENLYVQGWAIGATPPSRIQYSINGGSENVLSFYYRRDVHDAYPEYPTDNNGWRGYIPNASFASGVNTITFIADFGGERKTIGTIMVNNTYAGKPPSVSDIRITNVTTDGYTVTCKVTASNGLERAKFPTWTVLDGQDDITWDYKKVSGNTATVGYNVKVESHAYRHGLYCTHVYARDNLGYETGAAANDIIVPTAMTENDNSTYLLVDTEALRGDWLQTRDVVSSSWQARNLGAHLVSITSQAEQDAVAGLAHGRSGLRFGYWMGLNKLDSDEFSWTSGEEVIYTNWGVDQPADADNKRYGALMWETGEWENLTRTATSSGYVVDGRSNMGFIVEVPDGGSSKVAICDPYIVYDEDGGGFTVSVGVVKDSGVSTVQFPTWTASDQSDIRWYDATIANGRASCHVAKSDFGNKGPFYVHTYARDVAGNTIGFISIGRPKYKDGVIMLPAGRMCHAGHVYYVVDKMATFDTAETWASKYRGEASADGMYCHLATIDSAEEQRVVSDLVSQSAYPFHWIGLTDRDAEGRFTWVTGKGAKYANWASGEPDGGNSENHVLLATSDGKWRDAPNETNLGENQPIGYVVEFDPPDSVDDMALDFSRTGWVDLGDGEKGYIRDGALVTGWMDLNGAKYWFGEDGAMATGWTDVELNGAAMHYYFNPASGNLVRGTWFRIDGRTYYFRPSGNLATGWATISDNGVDKKYYLDADGQLLTGWRDIEVNGKPMRYYFRPSGAMATGWATIDGEKYWFRPSGNMATGWADVDDAYKRYFDAEGHMLTGWQRMGSSTYYFRASGAMQTGRATIDGATYEFSASGTLKSGNPPALAAQDEGDTVELGGGEEETSDAPDLAAQEDGLPVDGEALPGPGSEDGPKPGVDVLGDDGADKIVLGDQ